MAQQVKGGGLMFWGWGWFLRSTAASQRPWRFKDSSNEREILKKPISWTKEAAEKFPIPGEMPGKTSLGGY